MNLINLKMATAIAAVLTIVASLTPQDAYARGGDGESENNTTIKFDLNTFDTDDNKKDKEQGEYSRGILNLQESDKSLNTSIFFPFGTLKASRIETPQDLKTIIPGLDVFNLKEDNLFGRRDMNYEDLFQGDASNENGFKQGVLRYDAILKNNQNIVANFVLFLPSTGNKSEDLNKFINSLSGINNPEITRILGIFKSSADSSGIDTRLYGFGKRPLRLATVTEPTHTVGLLSFGALGAILLLRRNKRNRELSVIKSNRNATSSSQMKK